MMTVNLILCGLCMFYRICGGILISCRVLQDGFTRKESSQNDSEKNGSSTKDINKWELIIAAIYCLLVIGLIAVFKVQEKMITIMICAEGANIIRFCILSLKADRRLSIFTCVFYEIAVVILTNIATACTAIGLNDPRYLDHSEIRFYVVYLIVAFVTLIVSAEAYFKKELASQFGVRVVAGIGIFSMIMVNLLLTIDSDMLDRDDVFTWMYLALGLLGAVFVFQMRKQYEMEKELAEMKSNEAMMLEREYHSLSESYERNAKLFHDFRNHCGVLKNFLAKDKSEEALKYLEDLTGEGSSYSSDVWTGDETVDYLIGSKKSIAEQKGISFEADVEFPRNMNIKSSDLCAILGNIVDNSIEASEKVTDPDKRMVRLIIRRIQQMLVIKVENTYEYKPEVEDGNFKTSKTDGGLHGWGIKSARTAAEKYDGMVQSNCTDELFTTVVTLSFEGIRAE